jgi:RHH-type proline utilization regulon transcriptional repressor/proline dehydrogenase/delta 1-pyrroline-5-carboxylate dehydrogenase
MGRDIESRLAARPARMNATIAYSFDMLGEAALTRADAEALSRENTPPRLPRWAVRVEPRDSITARHSISIKLSALHPRYEFAQDPRVMAELYPVIESSCAWDARPASA